MRARRVRALLMGGQACVFYGAAEFSRDTDFAILAEAANLARLRRALDDLQAGVIAVPPLKLTYLRRGHAVHFRCRHPESLRMRVDVMAEMRNLPAFDQDAPFARPCRSRRSEAIGTGVNHRGVRRARRRPAILAAFARRTRAAAPRQLKIAESSRLCVARHRAAGPSGNSFRGRSRHSVRAAPFVPHLGNARFSPQIGYAGRMGNRRRILIAPLLVPVLCALGWLALLLDKSGEPAYEGKKLSAWLRDIDYGQPQAKHEKAGEAIRRMGTNTLPFLLHDLDVARQSRLKEYLIQLARKQSLFKLNWSDADERSRQATWAFTALGPAGSPAIPELLRLEESNPGYVPGALAGIELVALPYLIQGLTNKNEWVRGNAATYLANAASDRSIPDSDARMALPLLIGNLRDTNNNVRLQAASALKTIDPEAPAKAGVP